MNPDHFPDLSRCKKLTEIGFPETRYVYLLNSELEGYHVELLGWYKGFGADLFLEKHPYPSVMEMLDVIPRFIMNERVYGGVPSREWFEINNHFKGFWVVGYSAHESSCFKQETLPNALADLIIWLAENKYLTF